MNTITKTLITFTLSLICLGANAATNMDTFESFEDSLSCKEIQRDLMQIRQAVRNDNKLRALRLLDRLIDNNNQPDQSFRYISVKYSNDPSFRCTAFDKHEVVRRAERSAESACYQKGLNNCRVINSLLTHDGYIGSLHGTYYGYGCAAEAIARGQ